MHILQKKKQKQNSCAVSLRLHIRYMVLTTQTGERGPVGDGQDNASDSQDLDYITRRNLRFWVLLLKYN